MLSFRTYAQLALEDPEGHWELDMGVARRKPAQSVRHGALVDRLVEQLVPQLCGTPFQLSAGHARVMVDPLNVCLPDLAVVPREVTARMLRDQPDSLPVYHTPLPLVIDVWRQGTADYDVEARIPEYRRAHTGQIWLVHPGARAVSSWLCRDTWHYHESIHAAGLLAAGYIPGLTLDIDALFA